MKVKSITKIISLLSTSSLVTLSITSCNGLKLSNSNEIDQPKDIDPKPDPSLPTTNNKPSNDPLVNQARTELNSLINDKETKVNLYEDYSKIKETLESAYNSSEIINTNPDSTLEQLQKAIADLQSAIDAAASTKTDFDNNNSELVTAYFSLKTILATKDNKISELGLNDIKYNWIKEHINSIYNSANTIINNTLQPVTPLDISTVNTAKQNIENSIKSTDIQTYKTNVDGYVDFKKFPIINDAEHFKGTFAKTGNQPSDKTIVAYSSNISEPSYKFAKRTIKDLGSSANPTDVAWIYDLKSGENQSASYDLKFTYYGGSSATLYFPYKSYSNLITQDNFALQYKLNDGENVFDITSLIRDASVDDVKVAKIELTGLNYGDNTISFSIPSDKKNPIIGNMYITLPNYSGSETKVYNSIFGNEADMQNKNKITINFAKGYGLANKSITEIKKINAAINNNGTATDNFVLGYVGSRDSGSNNDAVNIRYYSFYVNAPTEGLYEISGIYNSGESRKLVFWTKQYNNTETDGKAQFKNLMSSGSWDNSLKSFDSTNKDDGFKSTLKLKQGLNKIVVSGDVNSSNANLAPNLGNVTFTLSTSMSSSK
ncbi:hypothetical protein [Mycoplasma bradburyae]|uniref:Haemagglutinin Mycoplasma domain-containing protein n=1 Tax=Mycoplasma bradburyae TaxID=2963128 RepID=A0AAW6HSR3_9MOLU|nr:hypothetical protein [Mycoplasma bradburyae]MDC4183550.1 hypothetical protein [Mycoplasma bradburyae]